MQYIMSYKFDGRNEFTAIFQCSSKSKLFWYIYLLYFTPSVEHLNDSSICNKQKDLVPAAKPNAFKLLMSSAKTQLISKLKSRKLLRMNKTMLFSVSPGNGPQNIIQGRISVKTYDILIK